MNKGITDFTENQLRDIFSKTGLNKQEVEDAVEDFYRYREGEISSLPIFSLLNQKDKDSLGAEVLASSLAEALSKIKDSEELIGEILENYKWHSKKKVDLLEAYSKVKDWDKVIDEEIYLDESQEAEPFIEAIETLYGTKVKDAKHLQKLTGIKEAPIEWLEEKILQAKVTKYERKLRLEVSRGAKYKELLQIKPKEYGLPESWGKTSNQYNAILWAISEEFLISEGNGFLMYTPSLRVVAKELDAPYSVLMDCYKLTNRSQWN